MGFAMHSLESPIVKGSSGLLLLTADQVPQVKAEPCIRCGTCVRNCPMGLEPTIIARWVEKDRMDDVEAWDALDCIECGCCSYGCPSSIPLVQLIRYGKSEVLLEQRRRKGELEKAAKEKLEKARVDK